MNKILVIKRDLFFQFLLIIIVIALYSFSWHFEIHNDWDDASIILKNQQDLTLSFSNICLWFQKAPLFVYGPLTMLSFMFDYNLWGLNSFGYHLQNIFWHIITVIAIYKCFRLFNIRSWVVFFLCLIYAVHPQRVESVVWLAERKDVLCGAFYFASIYFYIKNFKKKFTIAAFFLFILALLSKPMAVSLPLILILFEYYKQRTFDVKYYLGKLWPYFVLCFIAIIIMLIPGGAGRVLKYNSLIVVIHNVYWYFQQTLFPIELNPAYPLVRQASSAMGMVLFYLGVALLLIFILIKKKSHFFINMMLIMFGYLASLLPVVGLIAVGNMEYYDRFSYIPSVFIWFGLGLILSKKLYPDDAYYSALNEKRKKNILLFRKIAVLILIIYSFVLIIINYNYQKIWETPYSLFLYSANCTPASELAVNKLADYELGRRNYKKVWEISEKIDQKAGGKSVMGMYFRGSVKYHLDKKTAIPLLLAIKPYFKAYANDRYSEGRIRYIKILEMLIDSYNSSGDQQEANKYINERQGLP